MKPETALKGPDQPVPIVSDLDAGERVSYQELLHGVIESLKVSGGCLVRNFISQETVKELNDDFAPYFDKAKQLKSTKHVFHAYDRSKRPRLIPCSCCLTGDFWAKETRRITGCMGKSDAYALKVVGNELWHDVGRHFLTSTLHWWVS